MTIILLLLVVSLTIGAGGLGFFLWSLRSGQYDDLDGAATRILFDEDTAPPTAKVVTGVKPGAAAVPVSSAPLVPRVQVHAASAIPVSHS